ncbi:MAG TPA: hypothetical protein VGS19_27845 [Streptosporangiaceae bacterium]|nr:hypothetical protein [Streptosporangiaceae bacterium]
MRSLVAALSLAGAVAALLAGCGNVPYRPTAAVAPAGAATRPCTKINGWDTSHGAVIREQKKRLGAVAPRAADGAATVVANSGDYAYSSVPQKFTGPGTYTFDFGPLGASFLSDAARRAVTFDFPSDFPVVFSPAPRPVTVIAVSGRKYLRVSFAVKGLPQVHAAPAACSGLVLWAY